MAQFSNLTDERLVVRYVFESEKPNPICGKKRLEGSTTIGPQGMTEFGWMEGWVFYSGHKVTLRVDGRVAAATTVPEPVPNE